MTKRKLLAIFFALAMVVSLTACGSQSETAVNSETEIQTSSEVYSETKVQNESDANSKSGTFILVSSNRIKGTNSTQYVFYDSDTMVMYTQLVTEYQGWSALGAAMTRLDNPDGTPKIYSPDSKTE